MSRLIPMIGTLLVFSACAPAAQPKAPTSEVKKVTYALPVVNPVEAGSETQQIKDTIVRVVPDSFRVVEHSSQSCTFVQDASSGSALGGLVKVNQGSPEQAMKIYAVTTEKGYEVLPPFVSFKLEIKNGTTHVLPLDGVFAKLNINSKEVNLEKAGLDELHQTKLFPNDSKTITLIGPAWNPQSEKANIVFQLADVPVATDDAGKVTDVRPFTWSYQAVVEQRTVDVEKKTEERKLAPADAHAIGCPAAGG